MSKRKPSDETLLIHSGYIPPEGFLSLSTPIHHASPVVFGSVHAYRARREQLYDGYMYGLLGTPTTMVLAQRIADLEGGTRAVLAPSGLSAINMVYFTFLKQGDHVLVPDNAYGPSRHLCNTVLKGLGVQVTFYDPMIGAGIADLMNNDTRLVWVESPGSITMEVPDIPAIVKAAHARDALVAIDNTWSAGVYFKPFRHGCDISVQALTKYIGGHADLLLGAAIVNDEILYRRLKDTASAFGLGASPDDCFLALRGMPTLIARLQRHQASALTVAAWLKQRPEVKQVLHPAFPDCPGHEIWRRDFTGASGLFSVIFQDNYAESAVDRMVDSLEYFRIGASWGGPVSLVLPLNPHDIRSAVPWTEKGALVRFSIGLEDPTDLIDDLETGLSRIAID